MIKKILVATDYSKAAENAASFAIDMAAQMQTDLYCISVADTLEYLSGMDLASMYLEMKSTILKHLRREAEEAVDRIRAMAEEKGVKVSGSAREGENPAKVILDVARQEGADLIVVGSHGKTGVMDYAMGSITTKILNSRSPCPVLVVQAG